MSNSKKTPQPHWLRNPKTQQEKKQSENAKDQDVPVRGKRSKQNLPDSYDDIPVRSNLKKQNKSKKPSRDTIRKGEEDSESIAQTTVELPDGVWNVHFVNGKIVEVTPTFKTFDTVDLNSVNNLIRQRIPLERAILNSKQTNEQDEQSISKQMKKTGKATFKGPEVKERKKFAPATKVESPKRGKGSYNRKETFDENTNIAKFIDAIFTKNYADADKYIKQAVESKLQSKIEQELTTPLFK